MNPPWSEAMRHLWTLLLLAVVTTSLPTHDAVAEEPASQSPTDRFKAATTAAEAAYAAGDYDLAARRYLEAYEIIPSPDVIYNVGWLYERHLGKPELARTWYERVLRDPTAPGDLVRKANERITSIESRSAASAAAPGRLDEGAAVAPTPAPAPAPVVQSVAAPAPAPRKANVAPWALAGSGGALVIGGVAVGLVARGTNQSFLAGEGGIEGMRELSEQGRTQAALADGMWITGAVVAVAGLGWGIASSRTRTSTVRVMVGPGAASLAGQF
jgi:hypothetical protein